MPGKIVEVAADLRRRIWFRLSDEALGKREAHNANARAINSRNRKRARRFTENRKATPAYKRDGGYCGVWLPKVVEFPGAKCTGTARDKQGNITGRYWEPALNRKCGKLFADELKKWEKLPLDADFIKAIAPKLSPRDFSEEGHYFVRATVVVLANVTVLGVPNCAHNRKAPPNPLLVPIKASEVLALYEKQEELEEAGAAK